MTRLLPCLLLLACVEQTPSTPPDQDTWPGTRVQVRTSLGDFVIGLEDTAAPITTANFLGYVDSGFYDGDDGEDPTVFHRVIAGFMVQGGGHTETHTERTTEAPIINESDNGLSNHRGTLAMARTSILDSATSQFFINVVDNPNLDGGRNANGYAVFGVILDTMEIVDTIAAVTTGADDWPVPEVVIEDCERL